MLIFQYQNITISIAIGIFVHIPPSIHWLLFCTSILFRLYCVTKWLNSTAKTTITNKITQQHISCYTVTKKLYENTKHVLRSCQYADDLKPSIPISMIMMEKRAYWYWYMSIMGCIWKQSLLFNHWGIISSYFMFCAYLIFICPWLPLINHHNKPNECFISRLSSDMSRASG